MGSGILEAITSATGEAINQFAGLRLTRLSRAVAQGDTTIYLERAQGLPDGGRIAIDNIPYSYQNIEGDTLTGLSYTHGGVFVQGAAAAHLLGAQVTDISGTYTTIDQAKRSLFVDTAEGEDLSVVGRNLGVLRQPNLQDDAKFRALIKALAYNPRGTLYGLRIVLDALVGPGNYTVYEDLVRYPCQVFVSVPGALFLSTLSQGRAYLTGSQQAQATGGTLATAQPGVYISSVQRRSESFWVSVMDALPAAVRAPVWPGQADTVLFAASGDTSGITLAQHQVATNGAYVAGNTTGGLPCGVTQFHAATGLYRHTAPAAPSSDMRLGVQVCFNDGTGDGLSYGQDPAQFGGRLSDGACSMAWGIRADSGSKQAYIGLYAPGTTQFIGQPYPVVQGQFYNVELSKSGTQRFDLHVGAQHVASAPYALGATVTDTAADVGALGDVATPTISLRTLGVQVHNSQELLNLTPSASLSAALAGNGSAQLQASANAFMPTDSGHRCIVRRSTARNAAGGTNNGTFVATYIDATHLSLGYLRATGALLQGAYPQRIVLPDAQDALAYPDALGTQITIPTSQAGNAGTYTIVRMLDPITAQDMATQPSATTRYTRVVEVSGAQFVSEASVAYQLVPAFIPENNVQFELSDAAVHALNADGTLSITPRTPLPDGTYAVLLDTVLSAQVFAEHTPFVTLLTDKTYSAYPFYLSSPFSFVESYLSGVVAAGVRLNFNFT